MTIIFYGCKKELTGKDEISSTTEKSISKSDQELIADAKSHFDQEINSTQANKTNTVNNSGKTVRQQLNKEATFNRAFVQDMPVGKIVTTPVNYKDKEVYVGNKQNFIRLSSSTFLITYTGKDKKKQVELVTKIPDQDYLKDTTKSKKFSGIISVEDWYGNFIKAFKYLNGKVVARLGAPEKSVSANYNKSVNAIKAANGVYCYIIEYWSYALVASIPDKQINAMICCNFIDSDTYCTADGAGGSSNNIEEQINYSEVGGGTFDPGGSGGCSIATGTSIKGGKATNDVGDQCPPTIDPPVLAEYLYTSLLASYPKIKAIVKDLPGFLKKYPNVTTALAYYTGFTKAQVTIMMRPGVGPKVEVIHELKDNNGVSVIGHYDPANKVLQISDNLESALQTSYIPQVQQAIGLLTAITAMHEYVHYGRDISYLNADLIDTNGNYTGEAGWTFEYSISYNGQTGITPANASSWINFYPYNWNF